MRDFCINILIYLGALSLVAVWISTIVRLHLTYLRMKESRKVIKTTEELYRDLVKGNMN